MIPNILDYNHRITNDGTAIMGGYVSFVDDGIIEIPAWLKGGEVNGFLSIKRNKITSLKNSPKIIKGHFYCHGNDIVDFSDGPEIINGHIHLDTFGNRYDGTYNSKEYYEYVNKILKLVRLQKLETVFL